MLARARARARLSLSLCRNSEPLLGSPQRAVDARHRLTLARAPRCQLALEQEQAPCHRHQGKRAAERQALSWEASERNPHEGTALMAKDVTTYARFAHRERASPLTSGELVLHTGSNKNHRRSYCSQRSGSRPSAWLCSKPASGLPLEAGRIVGCRTSDRTSATSASSACARPCAARTARLTSTYAAQLCSHVKRSWTTSKYMRQTTPLCAASTTSSCQWH